MAYRIDDDFIEAFRNGGCFIFEGEEDKAPGPEEATDKQPDETSDGTEPYHTGLCGNMTKWGSRYNAFGKFKRVLAAVDWI